MSGVQEGSLREALLGGKKRSRGARVRSEVSWGQLLAWICIRRST